MLEGAASLPRPWQVIPHPTDHDRHERQPNPHDDPQQLGVALFTRPVGVCHDAGTSRRRRRPDDGGGRTVQRPVSTR
jgi:hypothetical protein